MSGEPVGGSGAGARWDATAHVQGLIGRELRTLGQERANRVLSMRDGVVLVGTGRSPQGQPVPVTAVQEAIDQLVAHGEVVVDVPSLGHRSSFLGAVLAALPGVQVRHERPPRVVLAAAVAHDGTPAAQAAAVDLVGGSETRRDQPRAPADASVTADRLTVTVDRLLAVLAGLRVNVRDGRRAPHKPVLVLAALARVQQRRPRLAMFSEWQQLIEGVQVLGWPHPIQAAYPFWHLRADGPTGQAERDREWLWQVPGAERFALSGDGSPSVSQLRGASSTVTSAASGPAGSAASGPAHGGLSMAVDALVRQRPQVLVQAAQVVLDAHLSHLDAVARGALLDRVGLHLADVSVEHMHAPALDQTRAVRVEQSGAGRTAPVWTLQPGEAIRRTALHDRYGGRRFGGIGASAKTPNVLVFTDPASGAQHGYLDYWDGQVLHYAGEGQQGDQRFVEGNKAIRDHQQEGRALRVFRGTGGMVTYLGAFALDPADPYYLTWAPASGGGPLRQVIMFRLRAATEDTAAGATRAAGANSTDSADADLASTAVADSTANAAAAAAVQLLPDPRSRPPLTTAYRRVDLAAPDSATQQHAPSAPDPELVDRGLRGHKRTQEWLADRVRQRGHQPLSPGPGDPDFDLAWRTGDTAAAGSGAAGHGPASPSTPRGAVFVAEVKSLTASNETRQLRLGLGQVLDYADRLTAALTADATSGGRGVHVRPVLAVERAPTEATRWEALCARCGVALLWPGKQSSATSQRVTRSVSEGPTSG